MKKIAFIGFLALSGLLFSCKDENSANAGKTPVTLKITDAPAYYDAILLNIKEVEIKTSSGKETIEIDALPFDILGYRMGRDTVLASDFVPSGKLQEIRLKLHDEGNAVVIKGLKYPLTTPSGQSSGIKIKVNEELIPDVAYTLLLDFDAAKSIHQTGNGKYMLKPIIRAIPVSVSGTIRGKVSPIESFPQVLAIDAKLDTTGTQTTLTGDFYIPGIPEGTYKIVVQPTNPGFATKVMEGISVTKGNITDLGVITLTP